MANENENLEIKKKSQEVTEEDLGKVAGGNCLPTPVMHDDSEDRGCSCNK